MKKFLKKSVILFLFFFIASCGCRYKTLICPNTNNPVLYPASQKCAKTFYQDAVKTYSPTLKAAVNVIEEVNVSVNLGATAETNLLKDKLSSEDLLLQEVLKSSFLTFQARPCDSDASAAYKKALDDAAQYRIKLETIKADLERSKNKPVEEIKAKLDKYAEGKKIGKSVGIIAGSLDRYYVENNKYPSSLNLLTTTVAKQAIDSLGSSIIYLLDNDDSFTLKFSGQDKMWNTSDDKLYKGYKGKPAL